jgi:hypothetical protein
MAPDKRAMNVSRCSFTNRVLLTHLVFLSHCGTVSGDLSYFANVCIPYRARQACFRLVLSLLKAESR